MIDNNRNLIDGLDSLKGLFSNDDDALVRHIIENTLFFNKEMVLKQAREVRFNVKTGKAIPVRYNSNGAFYLQHKVKTTTPNFKGRSEAIKFTSNEENNLFHRETNIRICFDRDGNYAPKSTIFEYTKHRVSSGQNSTVTNYVIAHIWERTDNPLFFSLLWNYSLIPSHFAFLTDKRDESSLVVKRVKDLIKAVSFELYSPNRIMEQQRDILSDNDIPLKEVRAEAHKLIVENRISFLSKNDCELRDSLKLECE